MKSEKPFEFHPIGIYQSSAKAPYEAARQPLERIQTQGVLELFSGHNYEQALENLEGFERLWVVYVFHHNTTHWKPKVLPPRGSDHKVGVFATRAPYRPNPIGMSCVKVVRIEGLKIIIEGADLLDGSPILDIKPYLPYADSFPDSKTGWLENATSYKIQFDETAQLKLSWLQAEGLTQLRDFILNQLEYEPTNSQKKRVSASENGFVIAYKTWRVDFKLYAEQTLVSVCDIRSGYSTEERDLEADPYSDKNLHRKFLSRFGS